MNLWREFFDSADLRIKLRALRAKCNGCLDRSKQYRNGSVGEATPWSVDGQLIHEAGREE